MKSYEREALLEKVDRGGSFVGAGIPEEIKLDSEEVRLRKHIFELKSKDSITQRERENAEKLKKKVRRKRHSLYLRLKKDEMTKEEGEEIVELIVGLDRALTSLKQLERETDLNQEAKNAEKADTKRWINFLRKVTGSPEDPDKKGRGK